MNARPLSSRYRTALVTGASTGLGLAFAGMLLDEGIEVWGTSRDPARLPVRDRFHPVTLELSDGAAAERTFHAAAESAGGFDLVINNAGFSIFGAFARTDFALWQSQLEAMLVNTARLSHAALRGLLARNRGALVNISSIAGEFALPYQSAYNVTKSGLSALNESLMYEVRGTGVIVIDFRPGDYRTDIKGSVRRPAQQNLAPTDGAGNERMARAWAGFDAMMESGPAPALAARDLRHALRRGRSGTVRSGRFFQAVIGPLLARFSSLALKRRIQEKYYRL